MISFILTGLVLFFIWFVYFFSKDIWKHRKNLESGSWAKTGIIGFVVNFFGGKFSFGWPQLSDSVVDLFREEYRLPLIPPHEAAILAALAEHALPLLLVLL